jgi:poly-gamma-glutamate synthesis protein (capsule biosynthesis protein)
MVQTYLFFVDVGVDAVINHHQHCPCGYEIYYGKPIYYGLGNFCFDWEGKRDSKWNVGYMVALNIEGNHHAETKIIPFRQCNQTPTVELLEGAELDDFYMMMDGLCAAITDEKFLDAKLKEFNQKNDFSYRKMLEPYSGRIANSLYRKGILPSSISKERILAIMDFVVCESHYERVKEYLERQYKLFFNE